MVPETPAQKLKALRIRKGLNMEALARILNVGKTTVAAWESGKSVPSVEKLQALASFYNISTDWIFSNELQEKELLRAWRSLTPE
jgi:transcriptional regulator with XRE-family HTH domain